jgi:hypothetical protein
MEKEMSMFRNAIAVALIGMAGAGMAANQAEAYDGRNAALIGGAALGVIAGAAIANAANASEAQPVGWYGYDSPTYYAPPPPPRRYVPAYRPAYGEGVVVVEPRRDYGGWHGDDWRWRRHEEWRRWHRWHDWDQW